MVTLLKEHKPKARKRHWCSMCHGSIEPGQHYYRSTYAEGGLYDLLECLACAEDRIAGRVFDWISYQEEGIGAEEGYEWAAEQVIHGTPDDQAAAKRYLERFGAS